MQILSSAALSLAVLISTPQLSQAADPFTPLPPPTSASGSTQRSDKISLSRRPRPQAQEAAPRFPGDPPEAHQAYQAPVLEVLFMAPQGTASTCDRVVVEFNQPMVDLDALDAPEIAIPPFSLSPRIPGRYLWLGTAVAAFEPEDGFPDNSEFTVLVPGGLVAAPSGQRLDRHTRWSFRTEAAPGRSCTFSTNPGVDLDLSAHTPEPIPTLSSSAGPCAPIPVLGMDSRPESFPELRLFAESPALSPETSAKISLEVVPSAGPARGSEVTLTLVSEATGEPWTQRAGLLTDDLGRLSVQIPMPSEEGFYRIHLVAADDHLGLSATSLRLWVRVPLEIRLEVPRSARSGDRFLAGVTVRNRAAEPREVLVRLRAANAVVDSDILRLDLGPGEQRRVHREARVDHVGVATFQAAAATLSPERALVHEQLAVPVEATVETETRAAYGAVENALKVPLVLPDGLSRSRGGVAITVTADPRVILTDAVHHVLNNDDTGAAARAAVLLTLLALEDRKGRLPKGLLPSDLLRGRSVDSVTDELLALQGADGGFPPYPGTRRSDLFTSAWCGAALAAAPGAGRDHMSQARARVAAFISADLDRNEDLSSGVQAFALRSLALLGGTAPRHLNGLYMRTSARSDSHSAPVPRFARVWLMEALHALDPSDVRIEELHQHLRGAALERGDGVTFPEDPAALTSEIRHSPDRTDAIVLNGLLATRASDTLIPRMVSGLIASSREGHWSTLEADTWAILALARFYSSAPGTRPSYEARGWLGDQMVLGGRVRRGWDRIDAWIPMSDVLDLSHGSLWIGKRGEGSLFYRVALTAAPAWSLRLAEDQGLNVQRAWSLVRESRTLDPAGRARWTVKEGEFVRLRARILSSSPQGNLVVHVPIPAGLRPVQDRLNTPRDGIWDSVEFHPGGLFLFRNEPPAGVLECSLLLRAETPGTWRVPPMTATALHSPGIRGSSAAEELVITP